MPLVPYSGCLHAFETHSREAAYAHICSMWILLKHPANRKVLSGAFQVRIDKCIDS